MQKRASVLPVTRTASAPASSQDHMSIGRTTLPTEKHATTGSTLPAGNYTTAAGSMPIQDRTSETRSVPTQDHTFAARTMASQDHTQPYILFSLFVAFSFAMFIIKWIAHDIYVALCSHVYVSILIILSTVTMFSCRWKNRRVTPTRTVSGFKPISRLSFAGMMVFCLGSGIFDTVSLGATADCLYASPNAGIILVTLILKPLYMGVQIYFLAWSGNWLAKYGIIRDNCAYLLNGFTNITMILYHAFYECRAVFQKDFEMSCTDVVRNNTGHWNGTHADACKNHGTKFYKAEDNLEPYLFSFHTEFSVLATALNLILWKKINHVTITNTGADDPLTHVMHGRILAEPAEKEGNGMTVNVDETLTKGQPISNWIAMARNISSNLTPGLYQEPDELSPLLSTVEEQTTSRHPALKCGWCGIFGLVLGFVYVLLSFMIKYPTNRNKVYLPLYFFSPFVFVCTTVITVHLYRRLGSTLRQGKPVEHSISVGSVVLMISAFGCNLFSLIYCISSTVLMSRGTPHGPFLSEVPLAVPYIIDLCSSLILLVQVGVQTKVMFFIHWAMKRNSRDDITASGVEQTAFYLLVMNFAEWMCASFVETKYLGLRSSECQYFGARTWDTIIQILFPVIVYFRFHSSMAFAEYLLWKKRARGQLKSQRQETGPNHIGSNFI